MGGRGALLPAVVAEDARGPVGVLRGHLAHLPRELRVEHPPENGHVADALAADGALVGPVLHVALEAVGVEQVPAGELLERTRGVELVVADRAATLQVGSLPRRVGHAEFQAQALVGLHAVVEIDPETPPPAADVAVRAVVGVVALVVVGEAADLAEVAAKLPLAAAALLLWGLALPAPCRPSPGPRSGRPRGRRP